ncbi:DUF3990 domain-containing protein [Rhizobium calliandrae]|uniref:DUF3990 domain-containing protein n=1 Tax=Rhizobium calliandrae TaxID=1312182 RepID=A0ABT7KJ99_9HYPH|nr:DUF3990 domain-containing protein [Rhizobium calliandrae]MDL2408506.1 DUF3990 domain-containing protein [Rhizobium calliandrae]
MPWPNITLTVYHGTDSLSGNNIRMNGILAQYFNPSSDFGAGFYVTTSLHQAKNWANERVRTIGGFGVNAEVLQYDLSRSAIETLEHLVFVTDTQDFHDLCAFCRGGGGVSHGRTAPYDAIYGPVSLSPQTLVIANCDQICFPNPANIVDANGNSVFRLPAGTMSSTPNTYFV